MTAPEPDPPPSLPDAEKNVNNSTPNDSSSGTTVRSVLGQGSVQLSDFINEHLIYVRPVAVLSVAALAIYSVSQTPLFFRYRTVRDIPPQRFQRRQWIRGRLVPAPKKAKEMDANLPTILNASRSDPRQNAFRSVPPNDTPGATPVLCYIRHLSPIESWMSRDRWRRYRSLTTPLSWSTLLRPKHGVGRGTMDGGAEDDEEDLIPIQIVGVQYPPLPPSPPVVPQEYGAHVAWSSLRSSQTRHDDTTTIQQWSHDNLLVQCQLYGRVVPRMTNDAAFVYKNRSRTKRPIPNLHPNEGALATTTNADDDEEDADDDHQMILGKVLVQKEKDEDGPTHRSGSWRRIFSYLWHRPRPVDLGERLVRQGQAVVADDWLWTPPEMRLRSTGDASNHTTTLQRQADVKYVAQLTRAEYDAAEAHVGIWSLEEYRNERRDVMEELQWQQQRRDTFVHRIWQWLTHRWRRD